MSVTVLFNLLQALGGILGLLVGNRFADQTRPDQQIQSTPFHSLFRIISTNKTRTVPLGDSITAITCWRTILWDALRDANLTDYIQFVGSSTSNAGACIGTGPGTWDHHHEGHGGYTAVGIADNDLRAARPDVVMFMLGTNDVTHGHATTAIIDAYTRMVGQMRESNAGMRIIVDLVIPLAVGNAGIVDLNAAILPWAKALNSTASPIYVADTNTGFTDADEVDGVHPIANGDRKIAGRLYPILRQNFNQNCGAGNAVGCLAGGLEGVEDVTE
ncbi:hypothetical protein LAWI1_G006341 [Lachnellula willkommii]|uniref:SGNH hydrolase-type esterase domain-containing protein n=1 Tax=Lachnellula willkommii TaxID=215461 RepID=A0A559M308_9HELO|nr:hypothetical protein LAWI1_G006341 [Lachnellula willkommii]